jgi:predicted DNA-binding transcriptional regulator YafY
MAELPRQDGLDEVTRRSFGSKELTDQQRRHLNILRQITAQGRPLSTSALWEMVGKSAAVTPRQLQRDLEKMAGIYDLDCIILGRQKLWSAKPGSRPRFVLPVLDENAALAFHLSESLLEAILPDNVLGSLKPWFSESGKLLAQKYPGNPWYERLTSKREGLQLEAPDIKAQVISVVYQALQVKQTVTITHSKSSGAQADHVLVPAGIVASNQTLYLLAYSHTHDDYTTFAMHRITHAELSYTPAEVPSIEDFTDYVDWNFNEFYERDDEIALVVDFDPTVQRKMLEYELAEDQQTELLPDKWLRVKATVYETSSLQAWLLSYGNRLRVISPRSLADKLEALRQPPPPPP